MFDLVEKVLAEQAPSGAFYTTVLHQGKRFQDENGFVTCLVLRELAKLPGNQRVAGAIEKALAFIVSCRNVTHPGFHFYPPGKEPLWARTSKAPRADDTALFAITLVKHGYMSMSEARHLVDYLDGFSVQVLPESTPAWVHRGAYKTWLDATVCPNRIDCCVNANIAAFLKFVGHDDHPGYRAATQTVLEGVRQATGTPSLTRFLSPYHPDTNELHYAMHRAVEAGVHEFEPALDLVCNKLKPRRARTGIRPVCGTDDERTLWFSHTLQMARTMAKFHATPSYAGVQ